MKYIRLFILIVFLLSIENLSSRAASNLLINGQKNATIVVNDSFTIAFDFNPGDTLAHIMIWIDANQNGLIDTLTDLPAYSSEEEGEGLIDGGFEDQDGQRNGSFLFTVREFWNLAPVSYIFEVYDQGGADIATLFVDHLPSSYSISGHVLEPPSQPFIYIETHPTPVWPDKANGMRTNSDKSNLQHRKGLPKRNILSRQAYQDREEGYASLTDAEGYYIIFVPDHVSQEWDVFAYDFWFVAPGYFPPPPKTVWVDGMITDIDFIFPVADILVTGNVTDIDGNLLRDDMGNLLNYRVRAYNHLNDIWVEAVVESSHFAVSLIEGDYDIIVFNTLPFYVEPYQFAIQVFSGDTVNNVDFLLYPVDDFIAGRVTKFGTDPVPYIDIYGRDNGSGIGRTHTESDTNGYYMLPVSSQAPEWELWLDMSRFPPELMVEGGNHRMAAPGDQNVDFNIIGVHPEPFILKIQDIPGDQGLQVRVIWQGSGFDQPDFQGTPISQYSLWRLIPFMDNPKTTSENNPSVDQILSNIKQDSHYRAEDNRFIWDFITTIPAIKLPVYSYVAPTLGDSTIHGIYWSYFVVVAHTLDQSAFFFSNIDSGYSIDNLIPPAPEVIAQAIAGAVELKWNPNPHPDVVAYYIYKSDVAGFEPSPQNQIVMTSETFYRDENIEANQTLYYRVAAEDDAYNRSYSNQLTVTTTDVNLTANDRVPETYQLDSNFPNPFNPVTTINYQISENGFVRLIVYNVLGEKVKTLVNQNQGAGYYHVIWNGKDETGKNLSSGVYLYQIEVNNFKDSKKMILSR